MTRPRSAAALRAHYDVERELADRLRRASKDERAHLYGELYDELFRRVTDHPQLTLAAQPEVRAAKVAQKLRLVNRFLEPSTTYLEVGCGDGAFANEMAKRVSSVIAVDVSAEVVDAGLLDDDVELVLSDGTSIPVEPDSIDVAFSDQLMEHLHPDDARDQLTGIRAAVRPGGWYVLSTPSRLSGPHDISAHFDDEATGFHLREYSYRELRDLLRQAGFSTFRSYAGGKGWYVRVPIALVTSTEALVARLPRRMRRPIGRFLPVRAILGINMAAS